MATVDKDFADRMVALNGQFEDDPPVVRIVEYNNAFNGVSYGMEYEHEVGKYSASDYVINPRVYWEKVT